MQFLQNNENTADFEKKGFPKREVESRSTSCLFKHCSSICNWEASSFEEAGKTCVNSSSASRQVTKMSGLLSGVSKNKHEEIWDIWGVQEGIPSKTGGLVEQYGFERNFKYKGLTCDFYSRNQTIPIKGARSTLNKRLWHSYRHSVLEGGTWPPHLFDLATAWAARIHGFLRVFCFVLCPSLLNISFARSVAWSYGGWESHLSLSGSAKVHNQKEQLWSNKPTHKESVKCRQCLRLMEMLALLQLLDVPKQATQKKENEITSMTSSLYYPHKLCTSTLPPKSQWCSMDRHENQSTSWFLQLLTGSLSQLL